MIHTHPRQPTNQPHRQHGVQRAGARVPQLDVADALHVLAAVDGVFPRTLERPRHQQPQLEALLDAAARLRLGAPRRHQRLRVRVLLTHLRLGTDPDIIPPLHLVDDARGACVEKASLSTQEMRVVRRGGGGDVPTV